MDDGVEEQEDLAAAEKISLLAQKCVSSPLEEQMPDAGRSGSTLPVDGAHTHPHSGSQRNGLSHQQQPAAAREVLPTSQTDVFPFDDEASGMTAISSFLQMCCLLFSFGPLSDQNDSTAKRSPYNGQWSSAVFLILYFAIPVALFLVPVIFYVKPMDADEELALQSARQAILTVWIFVGSMGIVLVSFAESRMLKNCRQAPPNYQPNADNQEIIVNAHNVGAPVYLPPTISSMIGRSLKVIGVGLFGLVGAVLYMITLAADIGCEDVWTNCGRLAPYVLAIIANLVRPIFMYLAVFFCVQFHGHHFRKCCCVYYGLMAIFGGILTLWFDAIVQDATQWKSEIGHWLNYTSSCDNVVITYERFKNCTGGRTSTYSSLRNYLQPYLYPFVVEFALFAGETIGHWYLSNDVDENAQEGIENMQTAEFRIRETGCIFVALLISAIYLLTGFLNYLHSDTIHAFWMAYSVCDVVYFVIMLAICLPGLYTVKFCDKTANNIQKISGLEKMLFAAAFGYVINNMLTLVASGYWLSSRRKAEENHMDLPLVRLHLVGIVLSTVQILVQLVFTLVVDRVKFKKVHADHCSRRHLRTVLVLLAICNLTVWTADSFITIKNVGMQQIDARYFHGKNWHIIDHFTTPFGLFFRFNSALLLLKTLFKLS